MTSDLNYRWQTSLGQIIPIPTIRTQMRFPKRMDLHPTNMLFKKQEHNTPTSHFFFIP